MPVSDQEQRELLAAAREAASRAYSPYSRFPVGAAILTGDGAVVSGCNVENASYGLTVCAERNAVFTAVTRGGASLTLRAVVIYTPTPTPTAPCGACRQVINEFGSDVEILSFCDGPESLRSTLTKLLPKAFGPRNLDL